MSGVASLNTNSGEGCLVAVLCFRYVFMAAYGQPGPLERGR